ncbi:MAG: arsenate reductase ArsC [Chlorobi bacterium]|nr:arsenate reductase ArsC [Chlorobiota bacterium]
MKRILILCTGNSCRSQMAEGVLKSLNGSMEVYSAGTQPAEHVHPKAVQVMKEIGIDISGGIPKHVDGFLDQSFDYVITVCDHARETCPVFTGRVRERFHLGFEDPAATTGSEEHVLSVFRKVRSEIVRDFTSFYEREILTSNS